MRRRAFAIFLALFQAFWLNVVIPGHTRGVVTVPGWDRESQREVSTAHGCCAAPGEKSEDGSPTSGDRAHCAVCFFAAKLSTPPVIDYTLPPLAALEIAPVAQPHVAAYVSPPLSFDSRGPPADLA
jgi:hypothetical protein